jgi:uncharacterized membrane protein YhaH (DUF805 family)
LRKYAVFSGRASRSEYWWVYLELAIVDGLLTLPYIAYIVRVIRYLIETVRTGGEFSYLTAPVEPSGWAVVAALVGGIFALGVLVPRVAVTVRRLQDANLSGWWAALMLLSGLGTLALLILAALPSKAAGARFDAQRGYGGVAGVGYGLPQAGYGSGTMAAGGYRTTPPPLGGYGSAPTAAGSYGAGSAASGPSHEYPGGYGRTGGLGGAAEPVSADYYSQVAASYGRANAGLEPAAPEADGQVTAGNGDGAGEGEPKVQLVEPPNWQGPPTVG